MATWGDTLDAVVRERGGALFAYAYVLTGDAHRAEDLVQEALVRVFRRTRTPVGVDAAHAYVKRAVQTTFIDTHRRATARPQADSRGADRVVPDPTAAVDTAEALSQALLTLPPRERACVVMRHMDGLTATEIGHQLGIAPGSVRRYLHDGIRTLQRICGDFGIDPDDVGDDLADHVIVTTNGGTR